MDALKELRAQIDHVDRELLQLLATRLDLVKQVGEVKHKHGCLFMCLNAKPRC